MGNALTLTTSNFDSEIKDGVTLVDFWAEWCGPCKMLTPTIEQLATDYTGKAKVAKINIDNEGEIAERFGVSSIPTLVVFKNGTEAKRFVGVTSKAVLAQAIDAAAG